MNRYFLWNFVGRVGVVSSTFFLQSMESLPSDVLRLILRRLSPRSILQARRVSRRWRDLASQFVVSIARKHCLSGEMLEAFPRLETLEVAREEDIRVVADLFRGRASQIRHLYVASKVRIGFESLVLLSQFTNLQHLVLYFGTEFQVGGPKLNRLVDWLAANNSTLEYLWLGTFCCEKCESFPAFPMLRFLSIGATSLILDRLDCSRLHTAHFYGTWAICSEESRVRFLKRSSNLQSLLIRAFVLTPELESTLALSNVYLSLLTVDEEEHIVQRLGVKMMHGRTRQIVCEPTGYKNLMLLRWSGRDDNDLVEEMATICASHAVHTLVISHDEGILSECKQPEAFSCIRQVNVCQVLHSERPFTPWKCWSLFQQLHIVDIDGSWDQLEPISRYCPLVEELRISMDGILHGLHLIRIPIRKMTALRTIHVSTDRCNEKTDVLVEFLERIRPALHVCACKWWTNCSSAFA